MPPFQPLIDEDLADAAPLDRDALVLVEVISQAVQRPAAEGQAQALRVGQRRGDDLGTLLGGVGVRPAGAGPILEPLESPLVEAADPGIDGGTADAQVAGDLAGSMPVGDGEQEPGALDESGLGRARRRKLFEALAFLGSESAERDFGEGHGCTSFRSKATPVLRQSEGVRSLGGCSTKAADFAPGSSRSAIP
jgi:hypothetical protein